MFFSVVVAAMAALAQVAPTISRPIRK